MRLPLAFILAAFLASPARAVDEADGAAFRATIERQITALRADDAPGAFALASPGIQAMFGTPERFLGMVRDGYPPVYRPRRFLFEDARDGAAGPEQPVRIEDADGVGWTAIYSFEKGADGAWTISGCRLVRAADQSV